MNELEARLRRLGRQSRAAGLVAVILLPALLGACDSSTVTPRPARTTEASSPGAASTVRSSPSPDTPAPSTAPSEGLAASWAPLEASPSTGPVMASRYDQAKFGFAAKGLRGEVMAFVTTSQVDDALAGLDFAATSTIAFFSLEASAVGRIRDDGRWTIWNSANVDKLIARAHASGTKVVISLARFSWSPQQTEVSATLLGSKPARVRLARAVADEVVRRGVDGVNVDFEPIPTGHKAEFTDLVRRIRTELDARGPGYQLTFDVVGHFESYDVAAALRPGGADAVYLMGYHFAGTFSTIAHGTAPLDGPRYSVADAIRGLLKVATPHQIIAGVPYYGHLWPTASGALNARTTGRGYDVLYRDARLIGQSHGTTYDPVEEVRRSAWRGRACATCPVQWFQLYFDDAHSLGVKWAEFTRQGLLGTGVWTTAFEGDSGELAAALRKAWLVGG